MLRTYNYNNFIMFHWAKCKILNPEQWGWCRGDSCLWLAACSFSVYTHMSQCLCSTGCCCCCCLLIPSDTLADIHTETGGHPSTTASTRLDIIIAGEPPPPPPNWCRTLLFWQTHTGRQSGVTRRSGCRAHRPPLSGRGGWKEQTGILGPGPL